MVGILGVVANPNCEKWSNSMVSDLYVKFLLHTKRNIEVALQQAVFIFTSVIANRRIDAKMGEVKEKKVVLLTKDTGWYGGHSGYYEQLPRYLADQGARVDLVKPRRSLTRRFVGKLYSYTRSWPERDQSLTFAELHFRRILSKSPHAVGHVLNFEEHYLLFSPGERVRKNIVATIHIPPSGWDALMRDCLPQLSKAIVLYRRDIKFLEGRIGAGKVRFIPHGVDTDFFRPGTGFASTPKAPSIVFSGQYLRNIEMLNRVIHKLRYLHPSLLLLVMNSWLVARRCLSCMLRRIFFFLHPDERTFLASRWKPWQRGFVLSQRLQMALRNRSFQVNMDFCRSKLTAHNLVES